MGRKRLSRTKEIKAFETLAGATLEAHKRSRESEENGHLGWFAYEVTATGLSPKFLVSRSQGDAVKQYCDLLQVTPRRVSTAECKDALLSAVAAGNVEGATPAVNEGGAGDAE